MNTTVLLTEPLDLGAGPQDRVTFANCRWHADDAGCLHIIRERPAAGTVMSFAEGAWLSAADASSVVTAERAR